jgi:hypothetical protein
MREISEMTPDVSREQVVAAQDLYEKHLSDWRLSDETFKYLRENIDFNSEKQCLTAVVALDSLYATNLSSNSVGVHAIVRFIQKEIHFVSASTSYEHVDNFAKLCRKNRESKKSTGPISFFSKFFHFYVLEHYPIYDRLARDALNLSPCAYVEFCGTFNQLRVNLANEFSARQLDRYLWLTGKWIEWKTPPSEKNGVGEKKRRKTGITNEVSRLFSSPTRTQSKLLNELTKGEYERCISDSSLAHRGFHEPAIHH